MQLRITKLFCVIKKQTPYYGEKDVVCSLWKYLYLHSHGGARNWLRILLRLKFVYINRFMK